MPTIVKLRLESEVWTVAWWQEAAEAPPKTTFQQKLPRLINKTKTM